MPRGTATAVLIVGAVLVLVGLVLAGSAVKSGGGADCGTALSPTTSFDTGYPDGSAEAIFNEIGSQRACESAISSRRWYAIVVAFLGVGALVVGGWGLNQEPTPTAAEPTPF